MKIFCGGKFKYHRFKSEMRSTLGGRSFFVDSLIVVKLTMMKVVSLFGQASLHDRSNRLFTARLNFPRREEVPNFSGVLLLLVPFLPSSSVRKKKWRCWLLPKLQRGSFACSDHLLSFFAAASFNRIFRVSHKMTQKQHNFMITAILKALSYSIWK